MYYDYDYDYDRNVDCCDDIYIFDEKERLAAQYEMYRARRARKRAISRARALTRKIDNIVIMDTETTGLTHDDEIVEIAIISGHGETILHSIVKPTKRIPYDAVMIHGIDDKRVRHAPSWSDINDAVIKVLRGKTVAIYNADYDLRLIRQSAHAVGCSADWVDALDAVCIMRLYAQYAANWSDYHGAWRWHKLADAAKRCGHNADRQHSALADAISAMHVLRGMARGAMPAPDHDENIPF